jgi:hypothetical protein
MKSLPAALPKETAEWVREGLITEAQRAAIVARYPAAADGQSRFVAIIATIGGVLFAVGVSLVIKANWNVLGDWTKIGGLVALLVGAQAAGWKLKVVDRRYEKTGDACLMIGGILFLCGIALVSQVFHLNSRPASGVMLWWFGIAAVPWLVRAKGAQFLSMAALLIWLGMEMGSPDSWISMSRGGRDFGEGAFGIAAVFYLLGLALWCGGIALRETRWSDFSGMHEKWGLFVASGALFQLGFVRHHWEFRRGGSAPPDLATAAACALGGALAVGAGVAAWRSRPAEMRSLLPWVVPPLVPLAGIVVVGPVGDEGWLWSGLAWLTLFVLSIAAVRTGLQTAREGWVNLGLLFLGANIVARYFDLFGEMLEGGVFFIVTGVLVTGLGIFLEKKRRALLAGLRREVAS